MSNLLQISIPSSDTLANLDINGLKTLKLQVLNERQRLYDLGDARRLPEANRAGDNLINVLITIDKLVEKKLTE